MPPGAPSHARAAAALERAGLRQVESLEAAGLVLLDLEAAEGLPALAALSHRHDVSRLSLVLWGAGPQLPEEQLGGLYVAEVVLRGPSESNDPDDAELALRLARAAERHHERSEQRQRSRDLGLLLELTADFAGTLDLQALLHGMTRRLAEEMDIARASLLLLDPAGEAAIVVAASDDASLKDLRIELSRYPEVREVARTGKPLILEDAPGHPLLEGVRAHVSARGIDTIAALPLTIRGEVLGVLLLRRSGSQRGFGGRELEFLLTVAHATAVALRNATLVQSVRGQSELEKSARIAAEERAAALNTYQLFFASVSEGVVILDEGARVLSLNPAAARLLDAPAQVVRGQHVGELVLPGDETPLMELLCAATRGEVRTEVDVVARTRRGRQLTLCVSASPLHDGNAAAVLSFRDVTLARQLADELRKTKDFLQRLIDSSVDAIIAADLQGNVILFNPGAEAICGWTAAEALAGIHVNQLYPPGVAKQVMAMLRSEEHGGVGRLVASRQHILTRSGEAVPVSMTASIVYEDGREVATVGIFTDLRARVDLEKKLTDAETRLEQSEKNAVIVALAGTAAHELNQPLTSVMGYAELLKRKLKEGDFAYRPVDIIYREAERMADIVRKIGKITRYETKAYVGAQQIVDLDKASDED
ncbi:PAS domain S-box protein [Aggregicoccus sp. 17bor-14]|nr:MULTISPECIES: GAF domain-containing sensor histidine kinase [Myxococcaceae]MBF5046096.1 PAS domain S-box protein [Simulacricoccus sp. 17bor-14]MRI91825.1 PAS domain S-box protein [Aggregicoccus sp. 17bor-14]